MSVSTSLRAFVIVGGAFAGGLLCGAQVVREAVAGVWSDYAGLDTLARALTTIDRRYVETVEPSALAHAAVLGMTQALDPYSTYHDPDEWAALTETVESSGTGIGVDLVRSDAGVTIARVIPGAPGALAGLQVGMYLETVDGHTGRTVSDAEAHLRGPLGAPLQLQGRASNGERFDLVVVRDTFEDIRVG
ncbi:MAG TPA: hypothetical protein DFR83_05780, partial [Deltaproteobacteria bacterium]|nr:hypothetical protein [Deltaproteobacteria bacterium]